MNFLGWFVGAVVGVFLALVILAAIGLPIPAGLGFLAAIVAAVTATIGAPTPPVALIFAIGALVFFYVWAYTFATASLVAVLPAAAFPLTTRFPTPAGVPVPLPELPGELFGRGSAIGFTATFNAVILALVPIVGPILAGWAFVLISLASVVFIARNVVFQGFLGWSGWLFPMAYLATAIGWVLFILNLLISPWFPGFRIRVDWTSGVIETRGLFNSVTGFAGGFSLGNFIFFTVGSQDGAFNAPNLQSHEVGLSLNTAAMGGLFLWIGLLDAYLVPRRLNLAYGELLAESRAQAMPGPPQADFFVRIWA